MTRKSKASVFGAFVLFVFALALNTRGAGEVDVNFPANLGNNIPGRINRIVVQPDGKSLAGGNFRTAAGAARSGLVRLNADGTVDISFRPPNFFTATGIGGTINAIAIQADGKIVVGGDFLGAGSATIRSLMRLNADGSIDATFTSPLNSGGVVSDVIVLDDGRMLISGSFTINDASGNRVHVAKLNADGTLDPFIFAVPSQPAPVRRIIPLSNGKIVAGSDTQVFRYNADGSLDASYVVSTVDVLDMELQADGRILVATNGLIRVNPTGGQDFTFPSSSSDVVGITLRPDGKFFVSGGFTNYNGQPRQKVALLNSNGTLDTSFDYAHAAGVVNDIGVLPDGTVVAGGTGGSQNPLSVFARVGPTGTPLSTYAVSGPGAGYSLLVQPNNKILVGGNFAFANGAARGCIARFNADGTLDTTFVPAGLSMAHLVLDVALQPDGKVLLGVASGGSNSRRLNGDGTLDVQFTNTTETHDIEYLPTGKILVAGRPYIRRYNFDGGLDTTFSSPSISGGSPFPEIQQLAVQPDGKIIIVGSFANVASQLRNRIARLNADGTLDATFVPPGGADGAINTVTLQPDGKILIGGAFTSVNSDTTKRFIARLNSNGTLDTAFSPVIDGPAMGFKVQPDGKILMGGAMGSVNGTLRRRVARVHADGTLDTTFDSGAGVDSTVWGIDLQSDGKVVYAGQFTTSNGVSTLGVGRLLNSVAPARTLFDYDGDRRADVSVFRPSENKWYIFRSSDSVVYQPVFATAGDIPVPADYDGDLKTDVAIWRPSVGDWWYLASSDGTQRSVHWGNPGDIPRPSDFDGDGKADFIVFRSGENNWYRLGSTGVFSAVNFGLAGDKPVTGDFDADGKSDVAIYRPSTGDWWWQSSVDNIQRATHFGISTDTPTPADFDGDGKSDFAVYRASTGVWYILNSGNGQTTIMNFGIAEDKPVAADYDGDGRADIAVFRPSTGVWYLMRSTAGFTAMQFGISTDVPTPNAFVP